MDVSCVYNLFLNGQMPACRFTRLWRAAGSSPTLFNPGFIGRSDIIIKVCVKNVVLARFIFSLCFMVVEERNPDNNF